MAMVVQAIVIACLITASFLAGIAMDISSDQADEAGFKAHGVRVKNSPAVGEKLIIDPGIRGSCQSDMGGRIFVTARGITNPYRGTIKEIKDSDKNLSPMGALSVLALPDRWPVGRYAATIEIYCFPDHPSIRDHFAFDIKAG